MIILACLVESSGFLLSANCYSATTTTITYENPHNPNNHNSRYYVHSGSRNMNKVTKFLCLLKKYYRFN